MESLPKMTRPISPKVTRGQRTQKNHTFTASSPLKSIRAETAWETSCLIPRTMLLNRLENALIPLPPQNTP